MAVNMRLKVALVECGEPQYVVARRAKLSETRFSRILLGRVIPTDHECDSVAAALGIPVEKLFGT